MQLAPKSLDYKKKSPADLKAFLRLCQKKALSSKAGFHYGNISLEANYIDPLSILQSIHNPYESHLYLEQPYSKEAVAASESLAEASFQGVSRFDRAKAFAHDIISNTTFIGDSHLPFAGPYFFAAFSFFDEVSSTSGFPAAYVFFPRFHFACSKGVSSAVANVLLDEAIDIEALANTIFSAYSKLSNFEYAISQKENTVSKVLNFSKIGGDDWYEETIKKGIKTLKLENIQKIVLARTLDLEADSSFNPLISLDNIRNAYPQCHACSIANGKNQSFITAPPERLIKVCDGYLYTEAVAGSAPRGSNMQEDAFYSKELLNNKKEREEHHIVVEYILQKLSSLGIKATYPLTPRILKLANLQHMHTPIKAPLPKNMHILDLVKLLHPTPAVGGVPSGKALSVIKKVENFDRDLYAGPIGFFNAKGEGEFIVGIRSALINTKRARLYAGCGIVPASNPKKENEETFLKFQAILKHLQ